MGGVGSQNLIGPPTKKLQLDKVPASDDKRVVAERPGRWCRPV